MRLGEGGETATLWRTLVPHRCRYEAGATFGMSIWHPVKKDRTEDALVTVGIDGCCVVTPLGDPAASSRSWCVTGRPAHCVAVCDALGIVFTASSFETRGSFWELRTGNRLARAKLVGKVFHAAFTDSGTLALTNSNGTDSPTLHLIVPHGDIDDTGSDVSSDAWD